MSAEELTWCRESNTPNPGPKMILLYIPTLEFLLISYPSDPNPDARLCRFLSMWMKERQPVVCSLKLIGR